MIGAIIFDVGNVLLNFDMSKALRAYAGFSHLSMEEMRKNVVGWDVLAEFELGRISPNNFYYRCRERLFLDIDYKSFCDIWNDIFVENHPMRPLLLELKRYYKIFCLSNINHLHLAYIAKYPIMSIPEKILGSCEVGFAKPAKEIYLIAAKTFGVGLDQCIYTDDIPENVLAIEAMGAKGIVYTDTENFKTALKDAIKDKG